MRRQLTYANVVSSLCLFFALGGSAYAVSQLPRNSVGDRQIKAGAVRSSEVKDRSLRAIDFAHGQLPAGPKGDRGDVGPAGPRGETGPAGLNGTNATSLFAVVAANGTLVASSGVVGTVTHTTSSGIYTVSFNRDVSQCAFLATVGSRNGGLPGDPEISANNQTGSPEQGRGRDLHRRDSDRPHVQRRRALLRLTRSLGSRGSPAATVSGNSRPILLHPRFRPGLLWFVAVRTSSMRVRAALDRRADDASGRLGGRFFGSRPMRARAGI
jgi:hypothetical protein